MKNDIFHLYVSNFKFTSVLCIILTVRFETYISKIITGRIFKKRKILTFKETKRNENDVSFQYLFLNGIYSNFNLGLFLSHSLLLLQRKSKKNVFVKPINRTSLSEK